MEVRVWLVDHLREGRLSTTAHPVTRMVCDENTEVTEYWIARLAGDDGGGMWLIQRKNRRDCSNFGRSPAPYSAGLVEPLDGFGPVMVAAAAFFSTIRTE
jgi:hypothetical protein